MHHQHAGAEHASCMVAALKIPYFNEMDRAKKDIIRVAIHSLKFPRLPLYEMWTTPTRRKQVA